MQSGRDAVIMELFKIRLVETDMGVSVSRKKKKKEKDQGLCPWGGAGDWAPTTRV